MIRIPRCTTSDTHRMSLKTSAYCLQLMTFTRKHHNTFVILMHRICQQTCEQQHLSPKIMPNVVYVDQIWAIFLASYPSVVSKSKLERRHKCCRNHVFRQYLYILLNRTLLRIITIAIYFCKLTLVAPRPCALHRNTIY